MRKTQRIDLMHTIRLTWSSFLAISMFVALSVAMFTGVNWVPKALEQSYAYTISEGNIADLTLTFPYGISKEDVEAIRKTDGVSELECGYSSYVSKQDDKDHLQYKISSIYSEIETFSTVEGTIPVEPDEIALEKNTAQKLCLQIGDSLTLDSNYNSLCEDTFTVTAIVTHPECVHSDESWYGVSYMNGQTVHGYLYVPEESFQSDLYLGYTDLQIRSDSLRNLSIYSDTFQDGLDTLTKIVQKTADELEETYIYRTVKEHPGTQSVDILNGMIENISISLTAVFLIVGFMVCGITIFRLINGRKTFIGVQQALGFSKQDVLIYYLFYTLLTLVVGCVAGGLLGYFVIEKLVLLAMAGVMSLLQFNLYFHASELFLICALEIVLLLALTTAIVWHILQIDVIELLRQHNEPIGKHRFYEKLRLWNHLSCFKKSMVNNLFQEKPRVLGTILGIAACTMLLISSLTLYMNDQQNLKVQFGQYYSFDTVVTFDSTLNPDAKEELEEIFSKKGIMATSVFYDYSIIEQPDGTEVTGRLLVPENVEQFSKLVCLESTVNSDVDTESGVWMSWPYQKYYGTQIDDSLTLNLSDGTHLHPKVDGYYNLYLSYEQVVMSKEAYESEVGTDLMTNAFLVDRGTVSTDTLRESLESVEGFGTLQDFYTDSCRSFDSLNAIILMLVFINLIMSVIIGLLLILNLFATLINNKKRELITLMINGFSLQSIRLYVLGDMVILTLLGILLGIIAGIVAGSLQTRSFTSYVFMIYSGISLPAILLGTTLTALIVCGMACISLGRISQFHLSDINK